MDLSELKIHHPVPFTPSTEQAIYIEGSYDGEMNAYIQENFDYIQREFHKNRIDFCYLPFRAKSRSAALLNHHNPNIAEDKKVECIYTTEEFINLLFLGNPPADLRPSIIICQKYLRTSQETHFLMVDFRKENKACKACNTTFARFAMLIILDITKLFLNIAPKMQGVCLHHTQPIVTVI